MMDFLRIAIRVAASDEQMTSLHEKAVRPCRSILNALAEVQDLVAGVSAKGPEVEEFDRLLSTFLHQWAPELAQADQAARQLVRDIGDSVVRTRRNR